ncbi:MAG: hypothetical protein ACOC46_03775 [Pirellulales bacterium]
MARIKTTTSQEKPARLRVVRPDDDHDDAPPEQIISRERLHETRARIASEAYWAGWNLAMRRSARWSA